MKQLGNIFAEADALVITAGAGMGVDSGLPDFRGNEGFWNAYPAYRDLGYAFVEMACPDRFADDPKVGWGFYGHRLNLYRKTHPHVGFDRLRSYAESLPGGCFVFTSNVDGHFQKSGFTEDQVLECHGSILRWQCFRGCGNDIWEVPDDLSCCRRRGDNARPAAAAAVSRLRGIGASECADVRRFWLAECAE